MKMISAKIKPIKCPRCGSRRIASILYGYPAYDEKLQTEMDEGRIIIGGCMMEEGAPTWQCADCGQDFERAFDRPDEIKLVVAEGDDI